MNHNDSFRKLDYVERITIAKMKKSVTVSIHLE